MTKESEQLPAQDVPVLNDSLKSKGQQPIAPPPAKVGANDTKIRSVAEVASLPGDFRISQ